jgi:hypothetical protein
MTKRKIFPVKKILLPIVVLIVAGVFNAKGQTKVYLTGDKTADFIPAGLTIGAAGISAPMIDYSFITHRFFYGPSSILNTDAGPNTTLTSARSIGVAGIIVGGADTYIQFRSAGNSTITANTTTYFRLGNKPVLSGLGIPVGNLLGLIELQNITGNGYLNATNYSVTNGGNEGTGVISGVSTTKLIIDKDGKWYAAVTPNSNYNSVRLNVQFPTDLSVLDLTRTLKVDVFNAFTISASSCSTLPQFTNIGEASGVTLNLGSVVSGLSLSQLVENPQYAINGNDNQYSSFSSGVASIGVANTVSQTVFYDHLTSANDGVHLKLGLSNSLIGLSLAQLNGIKFYAYAGSSEVPVYTKGLGELASLLGLDLLNLINIGSSHKELELSIEPGIAFDRIKIEFDKGLLGLGVIGDALRLYDVSLQPLAPTITIQPTALAATNICEGSSASFLVTATVPSGSMAPSYQWQYSDGSEWVNTGTNSSTLTIASTTQLMNNRRFRIKVSGGNASCPQQVVSIPATLTVSPIPSITLGTGPSECKGVTNASLAYTSATGSPNSYNITWNNSTLLPAVTNAALPSNSIILTVPPTVSAGTYNGNITVKNANGCQSPAIPFSLIIHPKIPSPHLSISSN